MDLNSLRSTILEHRRPSGRLAISSTLRTQILQAYVAWREQKGSQQEFMDRLGLKSSTFASWLASAKKSDNNTSTAVQPSQGFRRVKLSPGNIKRKRLCLVLPNGAQLQGLSLDQALLIVEKWT